MSRRHTDSDRLLLLLAPEGAVGMVAVETPRLIAILRATKGVSMRQATAPMDAGHRLVENGLAVWAADGRTLHLTAEGRARAARLAAPDPDLSFRMQHGAVHAEPRQPGQPVRARDNAESPLVWLARRKGPDGEAFIGAAALEAGERLRRDITFAQMLPSITARWDSPARGSGGGAGQFTDTVLAARQRVDAALRALDADMADLLIDVCGFLKGLETVERERRWPPRSAKLMLRAALSQLALHYGLSNEARGRDGHAAIRLWAAPDARPRA